MDVFTTLFFKVIPLYINIILGFIAGKVLKVDRDTIANLMFFIIGPVVIFNGVINTKLDFSIMLLPLTTFVISCLLCFIIFYLSRFVWSDSLVNLAAFSAGTANTGYFGLPVALMVFNDQGEGVYIMAMLGISLYENSVGYYVMARGKHTGKECAAKLVKLPMLYAFLLGLVLNCLGVSMPQMFAELAQYFKGAFTVLGMMIIGLGLASLTKFSLDFKFLGMTFFARFVLWPLAAFAVITTDMFICKCFEESIYKALILISTVPLAVNMVVLASLFKTYPEKAATTVLVSTLFAIVYIPIVSLIFLQ